MVLCQFFSQIRSVSKAKLCIGGQGTALKEVGIDPHMPGKGSGSELTIQLKSLGFVAVIKAVVAGEMDPKYAVDLSANTYQSLDSKRVVSTRGQRGSLEQTKGRDEGMWRR